MPSGAVTFLLTDVEGSTALWDAYPAEMAGAMKRHHEILHGAIARHGGVLPRDQGEGDGVFGAFARATDAVACAAAVQRALRDEPWDERTPLRVRIGLHTGEAELRDGNYFGVAVSRCARVRGAGHGGQILLSATTAALARHGLDAAAALVDLGEYRLKGLAEPERIYQLTCPDLESEFPALATLSATLHNLPAVLDTLVGRDLEQQLASRLLADGARLLTVTGPAGVGKTRLALAVAADRVGLVDGGVWFVPLAGVDDPAGVPVEVARVLGVQEEPGVQLTDTVVSAVRQRSMLLLLDNFEQVADAGPFVSSMLAASTDLCVIVTSREPLRIRGEQELPVSSLAVPEGDDAEELGRSAAVALFVQRAVEARPAFVLDAGNAADVAAICRRLDGLPLAIELAASRIRVFSPSALRTRLGRSLEVLGQSGSDAPTRHRTLQSAIQWSYDLLEGDERAVLQSVSVFRGGCRIEAAELVCGPSIADQDLLDTLVSLVEKSLLRQLDDPDGEPRFVQLQTIRDFSAAKLAESGQSAEIRSRLLAWVLDLTDQLASDLDNVHQAEALRTIDLEHTNIDAAFDDAVERGDRAALVLGATLGTYWQLRGQWSEGRERLTRAIERGGPDADVGRAEHASGQLALVSADFDAAARHLGRAVALFGRVGDKISAARAEADLASARLELGDASAAEAMTRSALAILEGAEDRPGVSMCLSTLAAVAHERGAVAEARTLQERCVEIDRMFGSPADLASSLLSLAALLHSERIDAARAAELVAESLSIRRELGDASGVAEALVHLGEAALKRREADEAMRLADEALATQRGLGDRVGQAQSLAILGMASWLTGDLPAARTHTSEAAALATELGRQHLVSSLNLSLGRLEAELGNRDAARRHFDASLAVMRESGNSRGVVTVLVDIARLLHDPEREAVLEEAEAEARRADDEVATATLREERARPLGADVSPP